jgi:hypothetical protein
VDNWKKSGCVDNDEKSAGAIARRVYNYAQLDRSALLAAESKATRILGQAGVELRWVDCPAPPADSANYPDCQTPWQANDYVVNVLPHSMAVLMGESADELGLAADCEKGPACTASVFYHRVQALSDALGYSPAAMLGYVMAHEIGHLLLRTSAHSAFGIMRARLTRDDLLRPLGFTPTQSLIIRADVAGRNRMQQAGALPAIAARN